MVWGEGGERGAGGYAVFLILRFKTFSLKLGLGTLGVRSNCLFSVLFNQNKGARFADLAPLIGKGRRHREKRE